MAVKVIGTPIEFGLRLIGVWPNFKNPLGRVFVWLVLMVNIPFQFWDVYVKLDDTIAMMDTVSLAVATFLFFVKINIIWTKRHYMMDIITDMMEDWDLTKNMKIEREILIKRTRQMRIFCACYMGVYTLSVSIFTLDAVLTYILLPVDKRKFVLAMHHPFDSQQSPYYEPILVMSFVEIVVAAGGNGLTEALIVSLALHVGTRVDIMKLEIQRFAETFIASEKKAEEHVSKGIQRLVVQHMRVIDFVEKTEELFAYISLAQCLFSTLIICAMGYVVLTSLESEVLDKLTLIKFSVFSWLKFMEIFCFCFAGEYLSTQTSSISTAFYNIHWYDLKPSDSKMLMFLIAKSQRPLTITAGKFVDLKLVSFTSIVKTAASYLSVLRQAT